MSKPNKKRNILLITTDQMRFDAIGCNGGNIAKTPWIDSLAKQGINYQRAHNQNVVCMPARATIITGKNISKHGVWMNGVSMPEDEHTIAHTLKEQGYTTALLGKAHFEPWLGDSKEFFENRMSKENSTGPHRGFDRMELANHFLEGHSHYDQWIRKEHPDLVDKFYPMITPEGMQNYAGAGDTNAPQVWPGDFPKELYHTDWVAERSLDWLKNQQDDQPWFTWMSFPDPHHPWDPPASELSRVDWRDVPLPLLYPKDKATAIEWLSRKPKHWLGYYTGELWTNLESPKDFKPCDLTADQIREINAMNHIENELIDEAIGKVLTYLQKKGWDEHTDIFFTTDHGELQGDYGLLFKGAYHTDALMRVPLIWRPAPISNSQASTVLAPVGHVDLAATFCEIADIPVPKDIDGVSLPKDEFQAKTQQRDQVFTEWSSEHGPSSIELRTMYSEGWIITKYLASSLYEGTEGELYNLNDDPGALINLWDNPAHQADKQYLLERLDTNQQQAVDRGIVRHERKAPV